MWVKNAFSNILVDENFSLSAIQPHKTTNKVTSTNRSKTCHDS